jgi:endogenous inhibitor of DNA gyrase (YacG/DUF329 family)
MPREPLCVNCPQCDGRVLRDDTHEAAWFPFCSERCRLLDLGRWFDEEHRIAGADGALPAEDDLES